MLTDLGRKLRDRQIRRQLRGYHHPEENYVTGNTYGDKEKGNQGEEQEDL